MSFKHKIVVEVVYRTEGAEEDQIALAEKPIYIASVSQHLCHNHGGD